MARFRGVPLYRLDVDHRPVPISGHSLFDKRLWEPEHVGVEFTWLRELWVSTKLMVIGIPMVVGRALPYFETYSPIPELYDKAPFLERTYCWEDAVAMHATAVAEMRRMVG